MNHWRTIGLMLLMISSIAVFAGCEDDPILEGPPGSNSGGSYGRLSMPDSTGSYSPAPVQHEGNTAVF